MQDERLTVTAIAHRWGTTAEAVVNLNRGEYPGIKSTSRLMRGSEILLPPREESTKIKNKAAKRDAGSSNRKYPKRGRAAESRCAGTRRRLKRKCK